FSTGPAGNFESLVQLLEPKTIDSNAGTREMDISNPGLGIKKNENQQRTRFESALTHPDFNPLSENRLKDQLLEILNSPATDEPYVGPPSYGSPHANRTSISDNESSRLWFNKL